MRLWHRAALGAGLLMLVVSSVPASAQAVRHAPTLAPAKCDHASFRVIIDVGHTPEVPGAISARGDTEYNFNLRLSRVIERKLSDAGFARTSLLLATGPAIPSLITRVAQANALAPDLLISIHHDSVPAAFKTKWDYEGKQLEFSDRFKGHSIFVSGENAQFQRSLLFGKLMGARLKARGMHYTPHYTESFMGARRRQMLDAETGVYRYDQLLIMKYARMPAVLLEAGSIVNRDEELLMGKEDHQLQIAGAIAEAVETFCASTAPKPVRTSTAR